MLRPDLKARERIYLDKEGRKEPALPSSILSRRAGINKAVEGEKVCIVSG